MKDNDTMLNPSFSELEKKADSRYTLVMLVSKRARRIIEGNEALLETNSNKPVSIALEEVMADKITYKKPENIDDFK